MNAAVRVVSELVRPRPEEGVLEWFARQDASMLRLTASTISELLFGIAALAAQIAAI